MLFRSVAVVDDLDDVVPAFSDSTVDNDLTIIFGTGVVGTAGGAEIAVGVRRDDFAVGVCNRKFGQKAGTIVGNKLGSLGKVIGWYSKIWEWNYLMGWPSLRHRCASLPGRDWRPIL